MRQTVVGYRLKTVGGARNEKARAVATGLQDPNLEARSADIPRCANLRSSHLHVISLSALKKWGIWSLDIKNAFLQADGFDRDVLLGSPSEW